MADEAEIAIRLTHAQVAQVVRDAAGSSSLSRLLAGLGGPQALHSAVLPLLDEHGYSRSTLRALLVLGAFPADGRGIELTDVARRLELSPSTTHRYVGTWMAVGLVEQDPVSRRYRRPVSDER